MTIEQIDQMLAWLDEGLPAPFSVASFGSQLTCGDGTGFADMKNRYTLADARNIAALLNGIRPLLNVAMCLYQDDLEDTNIPHIIEPLWQAFKEARDA